MLSAENSSAPMESGSLQHNHALSPRNGEHAGKKERKGNKYKNVNSSFCENRGGDAADGV